MQALSDLLNTALMQYGEDSAQVKAIQRQLYRLVGMSAEDLDAVALSGI
jgi:hypothetical protein